MMNKYFKSYKGDVEFLMAKVEKMNFNIAEIGEMKERKDLDGLTKAYKRMYDLVHYLNEIAYSLSCMAEEIEDAEEI